MHVDRAMSVPCAFVMKRLFPPHTSYTNKELVDNRKEENNLPIAQSRSKSMHPINTRRLKTEKNLITCRELNKSFLLEYDSTII